MWKGQSRSGCGNISIFGGHSGSLCKSLAPKFGGRDWFMAGKLEAIVF